MSHTCLRNRRRSTSQPNARKGHCRELSDRQKAVSMLLRVINHLSTTAKIRRDFLLHLRN